MPTLDDINFNELPIIAKKDGQISVWKAWKRAICAFNDPSMWNDTAQFDQYFTKLDTNDWGMAGYGMIVMDMDSKTAWSFNDYSTPQSFFLPTPQDAALEGGVAPKAIMALLSDPTQWPYVTIKFNDRGFFGSAFDPKEQTLDTLLPAEISAVDAYAALTNIGGEFTIGRTKRLFFQGRYLPSGWTVGCELGQDGPDGLVGALETLQAGGFPPPSDWSGLDDHMSKGDVPTTPDDLAEFEAHMADEDTEYQDEAREVAALSTRYQTLKAAWSASASPKIAPGRSRV